MLKNYIKIAWRNAVKNKRNSLINLFGLSIALTCTLLIALFIKGELQYDRHFSNADRIFRVNMNGKMGAEEFYAGYTPPPAGKALQENFPEIESYTRIYRLGDKVVHTAENATQEKAFTESRIFSVDTNFLQLLEYPLSVGDRKTCLLEPHSIVISETMVYKYFGKTNPIGKVLHLEGDRTPYTVTGILVNDNQPSSLSFDFLTPISNAKDVTYFNWSWVWLNVATYVKFKDHIATDPMAIKRLEAKFPAMIRQQAASAFERIGQPYDEFLRKGGKWDLRLQPLLKVHLYSADIYSAVTDQGNIKHIYFFSIIACFILLLACVNFMNLSTASASKRAKEIGIRKVIGSTRKALTKQFFMEAMVLSFLAGIIALVLMYLLIPYFNQLTGKTVAFHLFWTKNGPLYYLMLVLVCGLLAGSYPALYLSAFKPISILKGNLIANGNASNKSVRKGLIIFQFSVSIALIICTLNVYRQLQYTQVRDLGLDKENVIVLPNSNRLGTKENSFKNEVKKLSYVVNASISTGIPGKGAFGDFYVPLASEDDQPTAKDITLNSYLTDIDFIKTMGVKMLKGKGFEEGYENTHAIIINETAATRMGYKNPIGKYIKYPGGNAAESYQIIGVMKDFNSESLHSVIAPFALFHESSKSYDLPFSYLAIRVKPNGLTSALNDIETLWKSFSPDAPFEYSFLRDDLAAQYQSDQQTAKIVATFSVLAVIIACIGLLGLVIFATQQRTKEIGIRKVLGATITNIVSLLSKDFIRLVVIAIFIASPIAWWVMNKWLEDFAYHISLEWWVFALAGLTALAIAMVTVGLQAIKAAIANPVNSLRNE